ncbi:MAG: matrixin family metalloprotease [Nanoarchaeota archaeon]
MKKSLRYFLIAVFVLSFLIIASSFFSSQNAFEEATKVIIKEQQELISCNNELFLYLNSTEPENDKKYKQIKKCLELVKNSLEKMQKIDGSNDEEYKALLQDYQNLYYYYGGYSIIFELSINQNISRDIKIEKMKNASGQFDLVLKGINELRQTYSSTEFYRKNYRTNEGKEALNVIEEDTRETKSYIKEHLSILLREKSPILYIDSLPYGIDPIYLRAIDEAITYWETKDKVSFKKTQSETDANVRIQWVKEFGGEHLGFALGRQFIEIGLGDSICLGKYKPYSYESVKHIATHEIGHVLGHQHDENDPIMKSSLLTVYEKNFEETAVIPAGYILSYPVCNKKNISKYNFFVSSDVPIDIYVLPSNNEVENLKEGKEFTYYSSCSAENTREFQKQCSIKQSSAIVILADETSPASVQATTKEIIASNIKEDTKSSTTLIFSDESKETPQTNIQPETNTQKPSSDSPKYICNSDYYNCDDFSTKAEAQAVFNACYSSTGDIHKLDKDKDNVACESLP